LILSRILCLVTLFPIVFIIGGLLGSLLSSSHSDFAIQTQKFINDTSLGTIPIEITSKATNLFFGFNYEEIAKNQTLKDGILSNIDISKIGFMFKLIILFISSSPTDRVTIASSFFPESVKKSFFFWGGISLFIFVFMIMIYIGCTCFGCCCVKCCKFFSCCCYRKKKGDDTEIYLERSGKKELTKRKRVKKNKPKPQNIETTKDT